MSFSPNNLFAACVCAAALTVSGCSDMSLPPTRVIEPKPAPDFSIQILDGKTLDSDSLKGKIVLVNFWSVWSPVCAREIPALLQLRDSFGKNKNRVAIVGICLESKAIGDAAAFAADIGIDYPVSQQGMDFALQFGGIDSIPTTFVIDSNWKIVNRYTGKIFLKELRYELAYMVEEQLAAEKAERERAKEQQGR